MNSRVIFYEHTKLPMKQVSKQVRDTKEDMTRTLDVPNWNQGIYFS